MLPGLSALSRVLERNYLVLAVLFLIACSVSVTIDLIARQLVRLSLLWPSEISVMTFIWSVMLGTAVVAKRRQHFMIELLPEMPARLDAALRVLTALISLLMSVLILWAGYDLTEAGMRRYTPMMGYPLVLVYAAFPVAAVAMLVFHLEELIEAATGRAPASSPAAEP